MTVTSTTMRLLPVRWLLLVLFLVVVTSLCMAVVVTGRTDNNGVVDNNRFIANNRLHQVYWKYLNDRRSKRSSASNSNSRLLLSLQPSRGDDGRLPGDVFIAVKTSGKFHRSRLDVVLDTWLPLVQKQTWLFTDTEDRDLSERAGGHVVDTKCPSDHSRSALCCKMAAELETFLATNNRWFCHVDDDNYLNVAALARTLKLYNADKEHYLGKASIPAPLEIMDRDALPTEKKISFWFATGGAGFCLSRPLAEKMAPLVTEGGFVNIGDKIRLPDDVTVGYINEVLLDTPLTHVREFHSHLEPLKTISPHSLKDQVTMSYSTYEDTGESNVVSIEGLSRETDPTRFLSLHCKLYPRSAKYCL